MTQRIASVESARRAPRDPLPWLRGVIVAVVLGGIAAGLLRPFAPQVDPVLDPSRWFDDAYLALANEFRTPRYAVSLVIVVLRLAVPLAVALSGPGRRLVTAICRRVGEHRPTMAATAVVLVIVVVTDLLVLPLQFWLGYIHDGAYGFRTQGLAGWSRDWILAALPPWVLVGALTAGGWVLARRLPRVWPEVGGLVAAALVVVVVMAAPLVLEPLHLRTEPLPDGPLRAEVERLASDAGRDDVDIVVADASRRTTRQNAYVSGIGATRRIVLYDTLVEAQPPEIVGAVLAHELAHDRHGDLWRGAAMGAAAVAMAGPALGWFVRRRSRRGRQAGETDPRAAPMILAVIVVALFVVQPAERAISRQMEAAADLGGLELTGDPAVFLEQREAVTRANLGNPDPPRWVRALWSTHPSSAERMTMGERWPLDWVGPIEP